MVECQSEKGIKIMLLTCKRFLVPEEEKGADDGMGQNPGLRWRVSFPGLVRDILRFSVAAGAPQHICPGELGKCMKRQRGARAASWAPREPAGPTEAGIGC